MATLDDLLGKLWQDYIDQNPHARAIHQLIESQGETVVNDHIALRTFDDPRVNIAKLSRAFEDLGYKHGGDYDFPAKKLNARHFEHPEPGRPLVFISELRLGEMSDGLQSKVKACLDQMPAAVTQQWDFPVAGRPWNVSFDDYQALSDESEYAGWVAAWGFRANHFTVLVNALKKFDSLEALDAFLKDNGHEMNTSGGEIKGTPEQLLEQSSTLAGEIDVQFSDGTHKIPACYYEFARRYKDADGNLFRGFIAKSADKIFESTDRQKAN